MLDTLKTMNWPGALVVVALIAGALGVLAIIPPEYLMQVATGELGLVLVAFFIDRKRSSK